MKNLLIIIAIILSSCSTKKNGYLIEGKILGKTPASITLIKYENGKAITVDSTTFKNGEFKFIGSVVLPEMYHLKIEKYGTVPFFIENSNIKIKAHIDSLSAAKIVGSLTQNEYNEYNLLNKSYNDELEQFYQKYKTACSQIEKSNFENAYDSIDAMLLDQKKSYIKSNNNTVISAYIIRREIGYYLNLTELEELTNCLSPELKDSKYTKEIYEHISILRALEPGKLAPGFTQNDTANNAIKLSDFKGKYLLIDFWASWCGPCRRANPTVLAAYNKYNNKNFSILGVSMDNDKTEWLKAISDDQLPWQQASSLNGWSNPVAKLYGVNSIPHAILIDPDGKIIKRGIHAEELDEILLSHL